MKAIHTAQTNQPKLKSVKKENASVFSRPVPVVSSARSHPSFALRCANKLKEFFGLFSIILPQTQRGGTSKYISRLRKLRIVGSFASIMLVFISTGIIIPYYIKTNNSEATAGQAIGSTLTFSAESLTASVSLSNLDKDGTFATSGTNEQAKFSIVTDNFTGYALTMRSTSGNTLSGSEGNTDTFTSIANNISASTFSNSANTTYNNQWGIIPNYYYSNNATIANTDTYLKVPAANESITLDVTSAKNAEAKNYTIGIGARADYTNKIDTYSNTFILEYIANPVTYSITYSKNTTDTVNNMPTTNPQTGSTSGGTVNSVNLTSNIPTRTGYTFKGWCSVSTSDDTCSGTIYNDQTVETGNRIMNYGIDQTIDNTTVTLNAMWSINSYDITFNFDSHITSIVVNGQTLSTSGSSTSLTYNTTYPLTINYATNYKAAVNSPSLTSGAGTLSSTNFTVGAGIATITASSTRITHDVVVANNTSSATSAYTVSFTNSDSATIAECPTITSITPGSSVNLCQGVSYTLGMSLTDSTTYGFDSWSAAAGGALGNASSVSSSYNVTAATTLTAKTRTNKVYMQDITYAKCTTTPQTVVDKRDDSEYVIKRLADNRCWMLDNLALGSADKTYTLTSTDSNVTTDFTLPKSANTGFTSYNNAMINTDYKNTVPNKVYGTEGSGKIGVYYNYAAASAGKVKGSSYSSNGDPNQDICPKNWRLPTGGSSGQFQNLCNKVKGSTCSDVDTNANALKLRDVLNIPLSGYFYGSSAYDQGTGGRGYFWSSTRDNNMGMYVLYVDESYVYPQSSSNRNYGGSVRCVLKATS